MDWMNPLWWALAGTAFLVGIFIGCSLRLAKGSEAEQARDDAAQLAALRHHAAKHKKSANPRAMP
jgi:uncharacterized membrane-anchored protein YhcB (DUF1043 family)